MNIYQENLHDGQLSFSDITVSIWGLGRIGLPLAVVLADKGATVYGVDIDQEIVKQVNGGDSPINNEPQVPELVARYGGSRVKATTDGAEAAKKSDISIILVPTVLDENDNPILDPVVESAKDIAVGVEPGNLVILESTVPPGTTAGVLMKQLETSGLRAGKQFGLAFCPERTSSGSVVRDLTESYPKIVGGVDQASGAAAAALYEQINELGVITMNSASAAEAVKVFEGVYRDVNIAVANELAKICEQWGIDAHSVFDAANTQPYCDIHQPGVGVGGHCIPVYPHFVTKQCAETPLIETARAVNTGMPGHTVNLLTDKLAANGLNLAEASVLVLGLTYRPGVEELRYAPAIDVIDQLLDVGVDVSAHDPLLDPETIAEFGAIPLADPTAADGVDGIVLATGHEEYTDLNIATLRQAVDTPVFIDGRNFFNSERLSSFDYAAIGKPE